MKNEMILCTDVKFLGTGYKVCIPPGNYWFGFREVLETDTRYRQICTYTLVKVDDKFLVYTRAPKGSEKRLTGLDSIGVGGHVNIGDAFIHSGGDVDIRKTIKSAITRELREELMLELVPPVEPLGCIVLSGSPVDQVHVGVVSVIELHNLPPATEDALCNVRLQSREEVRHNENLETWSKTLVPYLLAF